MYSDLTVEESEALKSYILAKFKGAFDFNAWLVVNIWPVWRAARTSRPTKQDTSPINTRFKALDGSPITDNQLEKAAKKGEPLLEIATGRPRRFLWRIKGKVGRWVPLDYKGSF